jgi:hypothetical protein
VCAHVGLPYDCAMAPAAFVHSVALKCWVACCALLVPGLEFYIYSFLSLPGQSQSAAWILQSGLFSAEVSAPERSAQRAPRVRAASSRAEKAHGVLFCLFLAAVLHFSGWLHAYSAAQHRTAPHRTGTPPFWASAQQWQLCTGFSWSGLPRLQLITEHTCLACLTALSCLVCLSCVVCCYLGRRVCVSSACWCAINSNSKVMCECAPSVVIGKKSSTLACVQCMWTRVSACVRGPPPRFCLDRLDCAKLRASGWVDAFWAGCPHYRMCQ